MPIAVKNISYRYEDDPSPILHNVTFSVETGEIAALMGRTGIGKSTLLRLMAGLEKPFGGRVLIDGTDIREMKDLRRKVGIVFQHPARQIFRPTVAKEIAYAPEQLRLDRCEERVRLALEQMGFSYNEVKDRSPFSLSGGEKRRVALAGVLVTEPEILLLDEPMAGVDSVGRKELLSLLGQLKERGTAIVMVTHSADTAAECADRIVVLDQGETAFNGTPAALFSRPKLAEDLHVGTTAAARVATELFHRGKLPDTDRSVCTARQLAEAVARRLKGGGDG